ncbi:histidinol-phosphate aminotransferase [Spirochaetia bacterium]|nr:histidinol-phosphate aminotransferase [Spirochaetia bacterium]
MSDLRNRYWNTRVQSLSPYIPGEQPRDRKFVKLNTNENPYPPSPAVIEAIVKAAGDDLRRYPDPACTELRQTIAARYGVKPDQVFAGNGSDEVLAFAFGAFFASGLPGGRGDTDKAARPALFPDITYSFYPVYAGLWDVPYRRVPVRADFSINYEDYLKPSGGVIIPNPNAPTGRPLPAAELLTIAQYLEDYHDDDTRESGRVIIVDEAYSAFGAESLLPYIDAHPNLLTVHTLSKMGSLAGLRVGFAIGDAVLIEGLCRMRDSFNSYPVDRLAQAGAAAAIADTAYYDAVTAKVIATRDRVTAALTAMGFEVLPSAANFIFIRHPEKTGAEFFTILRDRGILARHFNHDRIADFLRVSIGTDDEMDVFLDECRKTAAGADQ